MSAQPTPHESLLRADRRNAQRTLTNVKRHQHNFLGTGWSFFEMANGKAYWVHMRSKTWIPSNRNENENG
jgi:hypothetical protein